MLPLGVDRVRDLGRGVPAGQLGGLEAGAGVRAADRSGMTTTTRIGIDLDETISEAPGFFAMLTNALRGRAEIHIVTAREPGTESGVEAELRRLGIHFDVLRLTVDKVAYIASAGIGVYFDDRDEHLCGLPPSVTVFKIREPNNFCFETGRWLYAATTGVESPGWP